MEVKAVPGGRTSLQVASDAQAKLNQKPTQLLFVNESAHTCACTMWYRGASLIEKLTATADSRALIASAARPCE